MKSIIDTYGTHVSSISIAMYETCIDVAQLKDDHFNDLAIKVGIDSEAVEYTDALMYSDIERENEVMMVFREGVTIGVIVHELIHTKNFIFDSLGIVSGMGNDEHEAYFMGYLTDQLCIILGIKSLN